MRQPGAIQVDQDNVLFTSAEEDMRLGTLFGLRARASWIQKLLFSEKKLFGIRQNQFSV